MFWQSQRKDVSLHSQREQRRDAVSVNYVPIYTHFAHAPFALFIKY